MNLAAAADGYPAPHSGRIEGTRHWFALRVYYEDTDLSGIVYHANYLKYCERARSDILRLLRIDQRAAVEAGEGAYAVADAAIRWRRPAKLDDALLIETTASEVRAASVKLHQRVLRPAADQAEGRAEILAELDIRVGFVGPDGKPRRQPDGWRAAFETFVRKAPE